MFDRARSVTPGGVNSPVRAFGSVGGTPRFIESASGSRLVDVDGNEFVDLECSWGPMLMGHAHPAEVEAVLLENPSIVDATVVGLPKEDGSELVVAAVSLADYAKLDVDAYRRKCREDLTGYKVPRAFFHLDEMPRDQMGKIRRRDVRDVQMKQLEDYGRSVESLLK